MPLTSQETTDLRLTVTMLLDKVASLQQRVAWLEEITGKRSLHVSRVYTQADFTQEKQDAVEKGSEAGDQGLQIEHQG